MKFLVLYEMPSAGMGEWMKKPEAERKEAEAKMKTEWDAWLAEHKAHVLETNGAGKTKRATSSGVTDVSNDVMMYSIVEAETAETASAMFEKHPHLGIPGAWIDIMPAKDISAGL